MRQFRDNAGRTWVIQVHVSAIKRVRGLLGIDLYAVVMDSKSENGQNIFEGLGKLLGDPIQLVDVIYCLCKDEADKLGITDEDFGRSMAGDAIGLATDAFLGELVDFFPDPQVRLGIKRVLEASKTLQGKLSSLALDKLDKLDLDDLANKLSEPSGNSQELSELILARLR